MLIISRHDVQCNRYTLTDNKGALTKFLLSVDWSSESEIAELPSLLELWKVFAWLLLYIY
jgi:hypothetical protein